jgi:hypothetical protein
MKYFSALGAFGEADLADAAGFDPGDASLEIRDFGQRGIRPDQWGQVGEKVVKGRRDALKKIQLT